MANLFKHVWLDGTHAMQHRTMPFLLKGVLLRFATLKARLTTFVLFLQPLNV